MKTMQKVIEENHKKGMEAIRKKYIKKRKKEKIINTISTIAVIIITIAIIVSLYLYTNKEIEKCVDNGNSENYCVQKLG